MAWVVLLAPVAIGQTIDWSAREIALIDSLRLANLPQLPPSGSNRFANSVSAARLGEQLFQDARFSLNGQISCSTCHRADYDFTDSLSTARGLGEVHRRSMPLSGLAYQRWFFWDGRADSLWAQALEPLENPLEHGIDRARVAQLIVKHYSQQYESALAPLPFVSPALLQDPRPSYGGAAAAQFWAELTPAEKSAMTEIFVNSGKAIAAFVRSLVPGQSRFDEFADALMSRTGPSQPLLNPAEVAGLKVFIGKGRCINCHNGPLFSNGEFHHAAVVDNGEQDLGRAGVSNGLAEREFSCVSRWSDAPAENCKHLRFVKLNPLESYRAFKTPTLRNVAMRPPYMHAGQFSTLEQVLANYQMFSGQGSADEIFHGELTAQNQRDLIAFLATLTATK
ncbi:MAG: cytochrome c peroxidase [Pseudomonadota bacterium]